MRKEGVLPYHTAVTPFPDIDPAHIRLLEELGINSWPALRSRCYDGWIMRFADGYTRRANSVQSIYPSSLDVGEKIEECERAYSAQGQDTIFKLTPSSRPSDLDAQLAARGYRQEASTAVQTASLTEVVAPIIDDVTLEPEPTDRWIDAFSKLSAADPRHLPAMRRMLASIPTERRFAALYDDGEIVATALAVAERDYVGFLDVVTAAHMRKQGLGTRVMLHLMRWAKERGARPAYLGVMLDNAPALRLYAKLGFRDAYSYWYRVKPLPSA